MEHKAVIKYVTNITRVTQRNQLVTKKSVRSDLR